MTRPTKDQAAAPQRAVRESLNWRDFDPSWLQDGGQTSLATELVTYRDHLDELLKHEGQYVVIKGTTMLGIYPKRSAALKVASAAGKSEHGPPPLPVLVKQIAEWEPIHYL